MEPTESRSHRLDALLAAALELEPSARGPYLEEVCRGDRDLVAEVEELLVLAGRDVPALDAGPAAHRLLWEGLAASETVEPAGPLAGRRLGTWRLVRELGRGGMATVYLAERADGGFAQTAAVKLIRPGLDSEEILRRFELERQILAALSNAHIARLLDGGRAADGRPYFVMEHVDGRPIDRYCDEERLTVDERLKLFLQAARAVEHAHRNLVVHRDLKPSNIVVTADGEVKLLDFGIAKLLVSPGPGGTAEPLTRSPARLLTPEYASPEQIRGGVITTASDIYQLGLLLYELLTGRRAHQPADDTVTGLERAVCEVEPVRPSTRVGAEPGDPTTFTVRRATRAGLRRRLRGDLDNIVLRALRKDPDRRYAAVGELAEDLERYARGLPVRARRETLGYRTWKFVGRHRVGLAAALAVAVAVVWALIVVAGQKLRTTREAERATQIEKVLSNVLSFPDPHAAVRPPSAVQFVDRTSRLIRSELGDQPQSQARLLTRAGDLYIWLGRYDSAIEVLEASLAIRRRLFGDDSLEAAESLESLARAQHYASQYGTAENSLRRALAIRRARLGEDHPTTRADSLDLGDFLHTRGRLNEAEGVLRRVIELLRRAGDRENLATALQDLGNVLRDRGAVDEAEASYREALDHLRALSSGRGQQVAVAEVYYARLLIFRGEFARADALLTADLDILRKIYDGDHPLTGTVLRNLGYLRTEQGRFAEAAALLEEAQSVYRKWLGPEHAMVARAEVQQAELALRQGHLQEARSLARSALDRFARLDLTEHPLALDARRILGQALLAQGRPAEAAAVLAEGLAVEERLYVAGDPRTAATRAALAASGLPGAAAKR